MFALEEPPAAAAEGSVAAPALGRSSASVGGASVRALPPFQTTYEQLSSATDGGVSYTGASLEWLDSDGSSPFQVIGY